MTVTEAALQSLHLADSKVFHTADSLSLYPGERITLHTRAELEPAFTRYRMQITVPPWLKFERCQANGPISAVYPVYSEYKGVLYLIWDFQGDPGHRAISDFQVIARVNPTLQNLTIESTATLITEREGDQRVAEEGVTIAVKAKGSYLKYLPAIYQDDELMGRFLMLFESFLAPLEERINHIPDYFDARLTPPEMIPWLASWTGLVLDQDLTESRRRRLLWRAGALYQRRGTRKQLQEYLEIITGGRVEVDDSNGFRLGGQTYLGLGMAWGKGNPPNVFSVSVHLPALPENLSEEERAGQKQAMEQKIRAVIETEKPAHTGFVLRIFYTDDETPRS